jgi:hypothetical protein
MKLVISMATRGRPDRLIDTIQRSYANWSHPETVMQVQLDDDDPTLEQTCGLLNGLPCVRDSRVVPNVRPRESTIADKWNRALDIPADVYLVAADDDPYVCAGYDTLILEAAKRFPDQIGIVYGHLANLSFSGAVAPTRKFCELMGGVIFPPLFPYWFVDHWTDDVARIVGRLSFANIRTDQSKPGVTQEMREPGWWATFFDAAYLMRRKQAHDIMDHEDFRAFTPEWQINLLKTHHPLIEVRSRMINSGVRAQDKQLSQWAGNLKPDERYSRVKQRAIALIPRLLEDYGMPEEEQKMFRKYLLGSVS